MGAALIRRARAGARGRAIAVAASLGIALSIVFASAAPASASDAGPVAIDDDRGRRVALDRPPRRVVSLLPSLTETVCALGHCDALVGVDRYSDWPAAVAGLPRLGGLDDAQVERIVGLAPDLVLASVSARVLDRLEALGLTVVALETRSLADAEQVFLRIGALFGERDRARARWEAVGEQIAQARRRVPAGWQGRRVYFEVSSAPHAAGETSFVGELLAGLGLVNIVPAALGPFPRLNPEFIVKADPDLILAASANAHEMPDRPGWSTLRAIRAGRICAFVPAEQAMLTRPGPRLGESTALLVDCLQRLATSDAAR